MPNGTGNDTNARQFYNEMVATNPELKQVGFNSFYKTLKHDKNLKKLYYKLALQNKELHKSGFDAFKAHLFPPEETVKKKESTVIGSVDSSNGSQNSAPEIADNDSAQVKSMLDLFKQNVSLQEYSPELKEGLLSNDDKTLSADDQKLLQDYQSLYQADPRTQNLSRDEIIKDLRLNHPDYEPPENIPNYRLPTEEEWAQMGQDNPEQLAELQMEAGNQHRQLVNTHVQSQVDQVYSAKAKEEKLSDAQMILMSDAKGNQWINEAWAEQNEDIRATDRFHKFKLDALSRQVDQFTSIEKELEQAAADFGGLENLSNQPELKDQVKTKLLNDRLNFGLQSLSPDQKQLYEWQLKERALKQKMNEQLNPEERLEVSNSLKTLQNQIQDIRDQFPTLYDPLTGDYIDQKDATPEQLERAELFEKKVAKESLKYQNTDLGTLLRSWNQLQSKYKYIQQHLPDESVVDVPGEGKMSIRQVFEANQKFQEMNLGFGPAITGDAADKLHKYWDLEKEYKAKFDAVNRALLLNQDPSVIDKGFWSLFGEHAVEGFGFDVNSESDFIENFVAGIEESGGVVTEAQKAASKDGLSEQLGKGMGDSIRPMVELLVTSYATAGLGSVPIVNRTGALLKNVMVSRMGNAGKFGYNLMKGQLQGTISFGLTTDENLSAVMGFGEGTVQGMLDNLNPAKWIKKSKYSKFFEFGTRSLAGMTGETGAEFVGDYLNNLNQSGFNWEMAFEQSFGRTPEEFEDKLLATAIMSGMFSGSHNTANLTFDWAKQQLTERQQSRYLKELEKLENDSEESTKDNTEQQPSTESKPEEKETDAVEPEEDTQPSGPGENEVLENTETEFYTKDEKALVRSNKNKIEVVNTATGELTQSKHSSIYRNAITEYKEHIADKLDYGKRLELEDGMQPEQVSEAIAEKSENPVEIAEAYLNELEQEVEEDNSLEQAIANELQGTRITDKAFSQDGDPNYITKSIRLHYFSKSGKGSLDQVVENIKSENPHLEHIDEKELTQNIVEFIVDHPGGAKTFKPKNEMARNLEDRFEEVTGFALDEDYAKRINKPRQIDNIEVPEESKELFEYADEDVPFSPKPQLSSNESSLQHGKNSNGEKQANIFPRIQPKPISGKKPKKLRQIILDLSKGTGQTVSYSNSGRRNSAGSYNASNKAIKVKFQGNLDVTAHEMGHSLDDQFGLLSEIPNEQRRAIDTELSKFWPYGSKPHAHLKGKAAMDYRRREGIAEWIRAHMVNPEEAANAAPLFTEWYNNRIPAKTKKLIDQFAEDVKVFVGATAHDKMASNIDFKPNETQKQANTVKEKIDPRQKKGSPFEVKWANKLAKKWTNELNPLEAGIKYAMGEKGITQIRPKDDVRILARLHLGINEKFNDLLENGLVDSKNKRITDEKTGEVKTLQWLLSPLNKVDEAHLEQELEEVITSMISERTVELVVKFTKQQIEKDITNGKLPPESVLELFPELYEKHEATIEFLKELGVKPQKEQRYDFTNSVITGVGGGIISDLSTAQARIAEMNELAESNPGKHARMAEAKRRYRSFADDVLRYMVDKGRMSERQFKLIKENNVQYVALQRVMETEPGVEISVFRPATKGKIGTITDPIKKVKGSDRPIINPYLPLMDTAYKSIKEADRNEIMLAFRNLLSSERKFYEGDPMNLASVGQKVKSSDTGSIPIFIDGKPEYWRFQKDIHETLKGLQENAFLLPPFMTALPSALRWTVTHFPVFGLRNWIRDTQSRLVISDTKSGFREFFGDKQDHQDFKLFGGGQFGYHFKDMDSYYHKLEESMKDLAQNKKFILLDPKRFKQKAWDDGYLKMLQAAENSNRIAEYRKAYKEAKKQGMNDYDASLQAAFKARDLLDFAVAGEYMRIINQMIPFSNAAVQGLKKTILTAQKNPGGFLMRWVLYAMLPAIANRILVAMAGNDAEEKFQKFPAYQRDLFYNYPLSDGYWISIPKPFEIGVFASGAERLLDRYWYDNEDAFDGYAGSVARSTLPVDESALAGPARGLVETLTNYDFFRQRHIIPVHEEGLDVELRNTDNASRIGKAIQSISGLDGRYADQWIKSNFSYYGKLSLKLSDLGRDDSFYQFDYSDLGIFRKSQPFNHQDVEWVLETARSKGLRNKSEYRDLQTLIGDYIDESDTKQKMKREKDVTDYAGKLRKSWKAKLEKQSSN